MYKGAILPLLLYGAPVWAKAMKHACNRLIYTRVQRLINIKIAKAFRTTSSEFLCILTGLTPIIIKAEEAAKLYDLTKGKGMQSNIDGKVEPKNWSHPADTVRLLEREGHKEFTLQIYTDGSKSEHGVGSGVAIFTGNELTKQLTFKLDDRCSNNQAEQLVIVKALEEIEGTTQTPRNQRTTIICTDSRITIDSLRNSRTRNRLIQEIRKKVTILERLSWTINLSWIKAHAGTNGNELADRLAKEAARNQKAIICYYKISGQTG
jgi:ribonuclease HI